jgi:hypothetical protein
MSKVLRMTGHFKGHLLDVRLHTDAINNTDERFNIQQIQVGTNYGASDINDPVFQGAMGTLYKVGSTVSLTDVKAFAQRECYNLSIADTNGANKVVLIDCDESSSASI